MQMELRHLHVVLSVAEAGSISRAAAQLRIAQSGLTAQLHRIEQEFGGTLFVRGTGGVALTELGEHVLVRARELLGRFDDLLASSRALVNQPEPIAPVQLSGPPGAVVAMLVSAVRETLPDREQTTALEHAPDTLVDLLGAARLDLAVLARQPDSAVRLPAEVDARELVTEPAFVALAADHPLAHRPRLRLADLADQEWVTVRERLGGLGAHFRLACEAAGFTPRCHHVGADLATAAMLVRSGHAVAALYPQSLPVPGTVLRPLVDHPLRRELTLVWHAHSAVAGVIGDIHAKVRKSYHEMVSSHPAYRTWWAAHTAAPGHSG